MIFEKPLKYKELFDEKIKRNKHKLTLGRPSKRVVNILDFFIDTENEKNIK